MAARVPQADGQQPHAGQRGHFNLHLSPKELHLPSGLQASEVLPAVTLQAKIVDLRRPQPTLALAGVRLMTDRAADLKNGAVHVLLAFPDAGLFGMAAEA
jgi:hypothetical protein